MKKIVVGVDGSKHAEAALRFAVEEATLRACRLVVVCAYETPLLFMAEGMGVYPQEPLESMQRDAEALARAGVEHALKVEPQLDCESKAVKGNPAAVLLGEAEGADMIVVGGRGRGGFAALLLGSVSQQVVNHAPCPVVVVR